MANGNKDNPGEKLEELGQAVAGERMLYLLSHDNPDPDALASMLALRHLLKSRFGIRTRLLYGGVIARPENRAMVRLLRIPVDSLDEARLSPRIGWVLIDTQPAFKNHSLPEGARVVLVFDHHPPRKPIESPFYHVRSDLGATCTLLLGYLAAAGVEYDWRLATAMTYGLLSETQDLGREASREDSQAYLRLIPKARLKVLASIKNPPLTREYYRELAKALDRARYYKNIVVVPMGRVDSTDIIHEMADLFLRFERRSWSLSLGWNDRYIMLSLRSNNPRARCGRMVQKLVRGKGHAGGHDMVAGGRIEAGKMSEEERQKTVELIIGRFMRQLGHERNLRLLIPLIGEEREQA